MALPGGLGKRGRGVLAAEVGVGEWTLIEGEALEVLATLPTGSADALVMDPPYCAGAVSEAQRTRADGQGLRSENLKRFGWFVGDNMGTAGLAFLLRSVVCECLRVVRPTGSALIFCDWRMMPTLAPAIESAGVRYQGLVVWDKGSLGLGVGFRCRHELVMHFTFGSPEYHARDVANVITCPRVDKEDREHQTQKPLRLLRDLIRVVCPKGGTVLDPFAGSGATGLACLTEGRRFIGVERDPAYVAIARRRLSEPLGPLFAQHGGPTP